MDWMSVKLRKFKMGCGNLFNAFRRCKQLNDSESTQLARCLGLVDLTALGVGSTLGLGVYVLAGAVAKTVAGPAVTLSFLVAAIASAFAGLCYAEFASRVPKAGSAYVYSYVSVGEFVAFTIGWNLILEYVIGTASVAKGMANYIDSLCNNTMAKTMTELAPINVSFLAEYPDFFAFALVFLITILLGVGVKESTKLNNVFTALNIATVIIVVIAGAVRSDPANWKIKLEDIPPEYQASAGEGGFMPWGIAGVMAGAAKCFFGFVGFDCVATTGEEAKDPKKDIPLSIVLSLVVIFISYFSIATVLTMMLPYYLQVGLIERGFMPWDITIVMAGAAKCFDCVATTGEEAKDPKKDIPLSIVLSLVVIFVSYFSIATVLTMMLPYYLQDADAPFPHVFTEAGMPVIKWIVTIGAIFALCTSLLGAMFPLPRVLYAMGSDGVLFRRLSVIHNWTKTPLLATFVSGLLSAIMAALFNLNQLIEMMSIGTLLAYTIVATSVLILRYEEEPTPPQSIKPVPETPYTVARQAFNLLGLKQTTVLSANIAKVTICVFFVLALATCALLRWETSSGAGVATALGVLGAALIVLLVVLYRQPSRDVQHLSFAVPLVPLVPYLSVCMNLYLMVQLDYMTWVRFIIWLVIGYAIYFWYGLRNSSLNEKKITATCNGKLDDKNHITTKF